MYTFHLMLTDFKWQHAPIVVAMEMAIKGLLAAFKHLNIYENYYIKLKLKCKKFN